jgi:hypothetical protein
LSSLVVSLVPLPTRGLSTSNDRPASQPTLFSESDVVCCLLVFVGFSRIDDRGLLAGPERGGRMIHRVSVTLMLLVLGSGRVNSIPFSGSLPPDDR